ncbi:hypothetical protein NB704_003839 [Pantoea ananatis]|nr:hypothetical protein [Pantoea ananatis]
MHAFCWTQHAHTECFLVEIHCQLAHLTDGLTGFYFVSHAIGQGLAGELNGWYW